MNEPLTTSKVFYWFISSMKQQKCPIPLGLRSWETRPTRSLRRETWVLEEQDDVRAKSSGEELKQCESTSQTLRAKFKEKYLKEEQ